MINVSKNITLREATKSVTAILKGVSNIPNEDQLKNMSNLAINVYEPLVEHFKIKIGILAFYINEKACTPDYIKHSSGMVMDLDVEFLNGCFIENSTETTITNKMVFDYIVKNLDFDTIIWQFGTIENPDWIEVSYNETGNRKRQLSSYKDHENKTQYKYR